MKKSGKIFAALISIGIVSMLMNLVGCTLDNENPPPQLDPLTKQVRVQVAYDASEVAFKFVWKSQPKLYPAGQANVGQRYPGHFHDLLKHNGTKFDRLVSGSRMDEDRVTFFIDKFEGGIANFATAGCAITCHTGMTDKHLLTADVLDHWHWRGGRSGPMGYAEDANLNNAARQRDDQGTSPSKFMRAAGDRFREDQAALTGTSTNDVVVKGFPRFVFNKGKVVNGFTVPKYFIANESGAAVTNPYTGLPQIKDLSKNRSLLVVYQDNSFDPVDKVNALDLAYLVYMADGSIDQLPAHLRDGNPAYDAAAFNTWKTFWDNQTGNISQANAVAKLAEIHQEWVDAGNNAMIARSVGFIYNSDQHDVWSERSYDETRNEWTVILYRNLNTSSTKDADLSGLPTGTKYAFSFAMHDAGGGSETHDISLPLSISNAEGSDIKAVAVTDVKAVNWNTVPNYDTHWVKQALMPQYTWDFLKLGAHPGASAVGTTNCITCHTGTTAPVLTNSSPL